MDKRISLQKKKSFLDKFQGKRSIISKEGLLHLLEKKRQSYQNIAVKSPQKQKPSTESQLKKQILPLTSHNKDKQLNKKITSSREGLINHTQQLVKKHKQRYTSDQQVSRQQKSVEFLHNRLKLPAINKSSSHSSKIKRNSQLQINAQIPFSHSPNIKKSYKKIDSLEQFSVGNFTKKLQLDQYALRHLQFLDRFEKQLINNQRNGKRSNNFSQK